MKKDYVGMTVHCHHDVAFEWCTSFNERLEYIKEGKPKNEVPTRVRLFKRAKKIPAIFKPYVNVLIKADAEFSKACAEWYKPRAEWDKAYAEWEKAYSEWDKARVEWDKARVELCKALENNPEAVQRWHDEECGCSEWNGKEIVFPEAE